MRFAICQGSFGRRIANREPVRQDSEVGRLVCTLIGEHFGLDASRLRLTDPVAEIVLEDDSFGTIELVMSLEERFAIVIPDDALEHAVTIADIVAYVDGARGRTDVDSR